MAKHAARHMREPAMGKPTPAQKKKLEGTIIVIPTRGRVDNQATYSQVPDWLAPSVLLAAPSDEASDHKAKGRRVIERPASLPRGVAYARQWIVEWAFERKFENLILLDDDNWFYKRPKAEDYKMVPVTLDEFGDMVFQVIDLMKKFPHVGIAGRQNNDAITYPYDQNRRWNAAYGVKPKLLMEHDIRFDAVPLMEDFHVNLSLLKLGYPNAVISTYGWQQALGIGGRGGVSDYRTPELQAEAARKLAALHKPYVTVAEKESPTGWWKDMTVRVDVRIAWSRAFKAPSGGGLF